MVQAIFWEVLSLKKAFSFLLAVFIVLGLILPVSAAGITSEDLAVVEKGLSALRVITAIIAALVVLVVILKISAAVRHKKGISGTVLALAFVALAASLGLTLFAGSVFKSVPAGDVSVFAPTETVVVPPVTDPVILQTEPEPTETEAPTEPPVVFAPAKSESSDPANFGIEWEIIENGSIVDSYTRAEPISFGDPGDYFALPGISTFRGNNYRNNATYGTATVTSGTLTKVWSHGIGRLDGWGGCAWTGQPLVVQWDEETKAIMNLYKSKKAKENLVEVIYATLDGKIHFYDLDDGVETRTPINVGMNFKGAGTIDPRGYPLLYVGSGLYTNNKSPRMHVISLITGEVLYEYGQKETFNERRWMAFDSSPLVDAETDTLIWPGECGILYTIKLNTVYDKEAGTISVNPDTPVKTRYRSDYSKAGRYLGYESSISVVDNFLYVSENGGLFQCIDLNTMELVWAQDTKDDSNSSPVFEWGKDGNGYVYTAPSLHWTAKKDAGSVSIYKLNAQTGEIVWEITRDCVTVKDVSGGVQATPLMGKEGSDIEDLIIYIIARVPKAYDGVMLAINRETGEVVWEVDTVNYAWSSPVAFYTEEGKSYIAFVNASGKIRLVDGASGQVLSSLGLNQTTEASPVVFNNMMVLGTREGIYGIKIS